MSSSSFFTWYGVWRENKTVNFNGLFSGWYYVCCIFLQLCYLIKEMFIHVSRRRSGLVICALISRLSGLDSRHGHCVVFVGKTLLVQCLSPPMCMDWLGWPCDGLASHPGGVEILLVSSWYRNRDKLWPDGPVDSCVDLSFYH